MENVQATSGAFSAALTPEEFGAYVISEDEAMPRAFGAWARDVFGAVKAWALRRFGRQIGAVALKRGTEGPGVSVPGGPAPKESVSRHPVFKPPSADLNLFELPGGSKGGAAGMSAHS